MANTVFILGAGASKQAGVPLMAEFLDFAGDLWKLGEVDNAKSSFECVFRAISELQIVHSKSQLNLQNMESVFAAFEMAKTLQTLANYNSDDIAGLSSSMKAVIVNTIQQTMRLPINNDLFPLPPQPYGQFIDLLVELRKNVKPQQTTAVITFNYDLGLDYTLHIKNVPIWYGLDQAQQTLNSIPIFRLHGSLNWAFCPECSKVIPGI